MCVTWLTKKIGEPLGYFAVRAHEKLKGLVLSGKLDELRCALNFWKRVSTREKIVDVYDFMK